jgi:hypothetical protein
LPSLLPKETVKKVINTGSYYNQTLKKLEIGLRYESNKEIRIGFLRIVSVKKLKNML